MMKNMFEAVREKFIDLNTFLSELDFDEDLKEPSIMESLNDKLSNAYISLNQGFCENAQMCEECVDNRDQLGALSSMIDSCESGQKLSEEAYTALSSFAENIPEMLTKMEFIYLELIKNREEV